MRSNCRIRGDDKWEVWLEYFALTESHLRDPNHPLDLKKLREFIEWDFSPYLKEKKDRLFQDDSVKCETVSNGIDEYDARNLAHEDGANGFKVWYCRSCEYHCEGDDVMKKRDKHRKTCKYYVNNPRSPVFSHMSSDCLCCVTDDDGKKRKWWRTLKDDVKCMECKRQKK